jgi:hypothetical protein
MALGETGKEASWFKGLFKELGIRMDGPVPIGGASQERTCSSFTATTKG